MSCRGVSHVLYSFSTRPGEGGAFPGRARFLPSVRRCFRSLEVKAFGNPARKIAHRAAFRLPGGDGAKAQVAAVASARNFEGGTLIKRTIYDISAIPGLEPGGVSKSLPGTRRDATLRIAPQDIGGKRGDPIVTF